MNNSFIAVLIVSIAQISCACIHALAQATLPPQASATAAAKEPNLLGKCGIGALKRGPYSEWFEKNYNDYAPASQILSALAASSIKQATFTIFFGSWCGDSKREVPRMLKTLHQCGIQDDKIELVAVDNADFALKQSPTHEERGQGIFRVPTLIVNHKGKEIGRIVEFPVESLERDLLTIVRREPSTPNYATFPIVQEWLQKGLLADSNVSAAGLASHVRHKVAGEGELNSCGYVLLAAGLVREAVMIFRVNATLFPSSANCFDSLAEGYEKAGNTALAARWYQRVVELDSKNTKALEKLIRLKSKT
jgi:thiol-disulfide isomerase/thioredoxin